MRRIVCRYFQNAVVVVCSDSKVWGLSRRTVFPDASAVWAFDCDVPAFSLDAEAHASDPVRCKPGLVQAPLHQLNPLVGSEESGWAFRVGGVRAARCCP